LLEAIMALLFIALMLGAVAGLFSKSMAEARQVQMRTRAILLAENKLAELQTGLEEYAEADAGDYDGKPEKFSWEVKFENSQSSAELKRLTVTIYYDDPTDGFEYSIHRLYSPSLNLSAEQMKQISADPVQIQALGGTSSGLQDMLSMLSEFTGGDKILQAFLKGGVPAMLNLYNKLASGKLSADELLALLSSEEDSSSGSSVSSVVASSDGETVPDLWTNYDTAGIEDETTTTQSTEVASTDTDESTTEDSTTTQAASTDTSSDTSSSSSSSNSGSMTRDEAIKRMQEILRRMANKK
jgi:hypothetical protein